MGIGDWGLGIGDWGLGIGDWAQSQIPNPQSPIPNPQSPLLFSMPMEKNKLKLVRYNKSLQDKLDISLINYKIYSGVH